VSEPDVQVVRFAGSRAGTFDLTWGQKWLWRAVVSQAPRLERLNVPLTVPVPAGADLTDVLVALAALMERHEALRTRCYLNESGSPRQAILKAGELPVQVREAGDLDPGGCAGALSADLSAYSFTVPELSVRAGVVSSGGEPAAVVLVVFHTATDGWGTRVLGGDLTALLSAIVSGQPFPPGESITQTADRLAYERGQAGMESAAASVRHWEQAIARFPAAMLPASGDPETPRFQELELRSAALSAAARSVAARHGVITGTVVLTLVAELLAGWSGQAGCGLMMFSHNRFDESTMSLSGTMAQSVPVYLDVAGISFARRLRDAHRGGLIASASGQFDPDDIDRVITRYLARTGRRPELAYGINLFFPDDHGEAGDPALSPGQARELLPYSHLTPISAPDWEDMTFYLSAKHSPDGLSAALRFDTSVVSSAMAAQFLHDLERRAIDALPGPGPAPAAPGSALPAAVPGAGSAAPACGRRPHDRDVSSGRSALGAGGGEPGHHLL
jgi:hypothetical protein